MRATAIEPTQGGSSSGALRGEWVLPSAWTACMLFWNCLPAVKSRYARSTDGRAFMLLLPSNRLTLPFEHIEDTTSPQELTAFANFH
jgi:hypothetical protein